MPKKYSALGEYFSKLSGNRVELTFVQIAKIIGSDLPRSATAYASTFWSNSEKAHEWAKHWLAAGWLKEGFNSKTQSLTFVKANAKEFDATATLEELRPTTLETLYDLLNIARTSTISWLTNAKGTDVKNIKANPNFCYDWAFGSELEGFALCVWHDTLLIKNEQIIWEGNYRQLATRLEGVSRSTSEEKTRRSRAAQQASRARKFDSTLMQAFQTSQNIRLILTAGSRRDRNDLGKGASSVKCRSLDSISWFVHEYDIDTGFARLIRGIAPAHSSKKENVKNTTSIDNGPYDTPDSMKNGIIWLRRGQPEFRRGLLNAYSNQCVITGCSVVALLEAAHIQAHSEGPNYRLSNGLLLRADIHTLFDVGLLSIDTEYQIHVASSLANSEYAKLHHTKLKILPLRTEDQPDRQYLARRHLKFTKGSLQNIDL